MQLVVGRNKGGARGTAQPIRDRSGARSRHACPGGASRTPFEGVEDFICERVIEVSAHPDPSGELARREYRPILDGDEPCDRSISPRNDNFFPCGHALK